MFQEILLRSGAVAVEIDRDASVIVLICDEHRIQDAIPLGRDNLHDLIQDFFTRHGSCERIDRAPVVVRHQRAQLQRAENGTTYG